jgi:prepilin-type N-terminal cleavage/methylation domain-containing protein
MREHLIVSEDKHMCRECAPPRTKGKIKMNESSTIQDQIDGEKDDKGFTLIEILIAIVLIGILSAVAVVGISNLVSKGSSASCKATRDAATAASAVYYTSQSPNTYPADFNVLTTPVGTAPLTLPTGVAVGLTPFTSLVGSGWTITMSTPGTATTAPVFTACP